MPPKEVQKYLQNANYYLSCGDGLYIGAYQDRLILGSSEICEQTGKTRFSKKSVYIPASAFKDFCDCLNRANQCFQSGDFTPWEKILTKYTRCHHVIARFRTFEDPQDPVFSVIVRWDFRSDKSYNFLVSKGLRDAINISELENKTFIYLKKGAYIRQSQISVLHAMMSTLLEYSFYEPPESKKKVLDFIEYVLSKENHRNFIKEKLKDYDSLSFKSKIKLINNLLIQFFEDSEDLGGEAELKVYLDTLTNKIILIFSILSFHIHQEE